MIDACYSCVFGTFLCNTDQERRVLYRVGEKTVSLWSYVLSHKEIFSNPVFDQEMAYKSPKGRIGE